MGLVVIEGKGWGRGNWRKWPKGTSFQLQDKSPDAPYNTVAAAEAALPCAGTLLRDETRRVLITRRTFFPPVFFPSFSMNCVHLRRRVLPDPPVAITAQHTCKWNRHAAHAVNLDTGVCQLPPPGGKIRGSWMCSFSVRNKRSGFVERITGSFSVQHCTREWGDQYRGHLSSVNP